MKLAPLLLLALLATLEAAPVPAQTVERWQAAAVLKYPALKEPGSPLNRQFLAIVAAKRQAEPGFFTPADWPMRAADLAVEGLKAAETAAQAQAQAEEAKAQAEAKAAKSMTRDQQERALLAQERADEAAQWEARKAKWIFDKLIFGDSEDVIIRKLNASKLVAPRVAPSLRVDLNSRYRWIVGERKFNLEFEMKESLVAVSFACLAEKTTELDTLVREDWDKLRAAAIELFGPPSKTTDFPDTKGLRRGGLTVTDLWERPGAVIALGVAESESRCHPALRISDPVLGGAPPVLPKKP